MCLVRKVRCTSASLLSPPSFLSLLCLSLFPSHPRCHPPAHTHSPLLAKRVAVQGNAHMKSTLPASAKLEGCYHYWAVKHSPGPMSLCQTGLGSQTDREEVVVSHRSTSLPSFPGPWTPFRITAVHSQPPFLGLSVSYQALPSLLLTFNLYATHNHGCSPPDRPIHYTWPHDWSAEGVHSL